MSLVKKPLASHYEPVLLKDKKQKKQHGKYKVFIKVDSIDWGSYQTKKTHSYTICVGPKLSYMPYAYEFKDNGKPIPKVWEFWYNHYSSSKFVIALFKNNLILDNDLLGFADIKLSNFTKDTVSSAVFTLQSQTLQLENPITVKVMVHVCENGAIAFDPNTLPPRKKQLRPTIAQLTVNE